MAEIAIKDNGSGRELRLDPYQHSHQLTVGRTHIRLDKNGAVVRKTLRCGLPVSVAVPSKAFKGVAAKAVEDETGNMTVSLELMHHDPELSIPLLKASDMDDIAADWHSWSRLMRLPMLVIDLDGEATPAQKMLGAIMVEDPIVRRKRITSVKHRPYFLRRRKAGAIGKIERLTAREIIARQ